MKYSYTGTQCVLFKTKERNKFGIWLNIEELQRFLQCSSECEFKKVSVPLKDLLNSKVLYRANNLHYLEDIPLEDLEVTMCYRRAGRGIGYWNVYELIITNRRAVNIAPSKLYLYPEEIFTFEDDLLPFKG